MLTTLLGNAVPRTVAPLLSDLWWRRADGTRTLYLTFDDGPDETTPALLDLLARYDVPATFFLIGAKARSQPGLVRAVKDAGHSVGQHTDTHPDPWRTAAPSLVAEMEAATAALEGLLGEPVRFARPPYGHVNGAMRAWCRERGQQIVMWDVMPGDFLSSATSADIGRRVLRLSRPGSIIVLHEGGHARRVTPPALERVIPTLLDDGYTFAAL